MHDISSKKNFWHSKFAHSTQSVCCFDIQGNVCYVSENFHTFLGIAAINSYTELFVGASPTIQSSGEASEALSQNHFATTLEEGSCLFSWQHTLPHGGEREVIYVLSLAYYKHEKYLVAKVSDIANLTPKVQKDLEDYKKTYPLFAYAPTALALWRNGIELLHCNSPFLELLNIESIDDYKKNPVKFMPEFQANGLPSREAGHRYLSEALKNGRTDMEWDWLDSAGNTVQTGNIIIAKNIDGEQLTLQFIYDLNAKRQLQVAEESAQNIIDNTPLAAEIWNEKLEILDCSLACVILF